MANTEIWKPIPGYEGCYEASDLGRVRRIRTFGRTPRSICRILSQRGIVTAGYPCVCLSDMDNGKPLQSFMVHRLIWETFMGPIPPDKEINHLNHVRTDPRLCNLECVTHRENVQWAAKAGRMLRGEKNHFCKLTESDVMTIRIRYQAGDRPVDIAMDYPGMSYPAIRRAATGVTWTWLK